MIRQGFKAKLVYSLLLFPGSWSLSTTKSKSSPAFPTPTAADIRFDEWCDDCGVHRVGVRTVTTPRSLGGRGLFATKPLASGSVVASIPSKLAIAAEEGVEWQVSLTNQVIAMKDDKSNEWIQSWHGSGSLEIASLFESGDDPDAVDSFVNKLVCQGMITKEGAIAELKERMGNYKRRLEHLESKEDTAFWYTLVMSRAAYLGKDWDYNTGALPFFDMLNHCHDETKSNTELMTFGDCLDRIASEGGGSDVGLDRKDMLLVLTKDVKEGEELLTQYATNIDNEDTQLELLIQYGIPPP